MGIGFETIDDDFVDVHVVKVKEEERGERGERGEKRERGGGWIEERGCQEKQGDLKK